MTGKLRLSPLARSVTLAVSAVALSACQVGSGMPFGPGASDTAAPATGAASTSATTPSGSATLSSTDIEAPDVFQTAEVGLWDGRPSLGGVWVAHPDVTDPERVLITNAQTGQTVVGALFRRERDNPGPALMVSSDAAAALNVIAGSPTEMTVVALRTAPEPEPIQIAAASPPPEADAASTIEAVTPIEAVTATATALPADIADAPVDAIAAAEAAIDAAEATAPDAAAPLLAAALPGDAEPQTPLEPRPVPVARMTEATIASDILAELAEAEAAAEAAAAAQAETLLTAGVEETTLASASTPQTAAAASITTAALPSPGAEPDEVADTAPAPPQTEDLDRPYVQVAVFTGVDNAETAADGLRSNGVLPTLREEEANDGSPYWRLVIGPSPNAEDRAALLEVVQGLGYEDAFFVAN
ncbi:MAG: SPOR domain-containing protein [Pseudomonadota bacterium]